MEGNGTSIQGLRAAAEGGDSIRYHGLQAAGLLRGTERERQLSSPLSFLRGFEHAPQFADLDTNLYKEV